MDSFSKMGSAISGMFGGGEETDGMGLAIGESGDFDVGDGFNADDLFSVDTMDETGNNVEMVSGDELTSIVLKQGADKASLDWASELMLLTHEPLRRDMLEMQRALQTKFFGELPEGWRVRCFFRYFTGWCSLVSQQHAIEVSVHYDWLAQPTGKMKGEQRQELLAYHRSIELELLAISRLEGKIIEELAGAADWTTSEPFSEEAQELREKFTKLCNEIRVHLATQESILPPMLREYWGRVSPPSLVDKALAAAKRAQSIASKGPDKPKMLMWIKHYLSKRSISRANQLVAKLPFNKRMAVQFGRMMEHDELIKYLRCIIEDKQPSDDSLQVDMKAIKAAQQQAEDEPSKPKGPGTGREKQRKAGMVNAVLASANARRVDVPLQDNQMARQLASSEDPLHKFKMDGAWQNKTKAVPDNLYKKIGIDNIDAPRRL